MRLHVVVERAMADGQSADEWTMYQAVASKLLPAVPHDFTLAAAASSAAASSSAAERASLAGSATPSSAAAGPGGPSGATAGSSLGSNAWGASSTSLSPSVASTATGASPAMAPDAGPAGNGAAAAQGQQKDLTARRTPLRIHLPDAPVLMEAAKAWSDDGESAQCSARALPGLTLGHQAGRCP